MKETNLHKVVYHMVPFILQSQNYKTMEMKKRLFVARDYRGKEGLLG